MLLDESDLANNIRQAELLLQESREHSARPLDSVPDPGARFNLLDRGQLEVLRRRHSFLNEYSDSMLINTPIETLLKLENTSIKLKNLEKSRDAEEKLAGNREALVTSEIPVMAGIDNRWSILHEARFMPGAACSAAKLWLRAREVLGTGSKPAVSVYDMAGVGLAGHVTPKGWLVLGDPGNSSISISMFSISNCGRKEKIGKGDSVREDDAREIGELGELKVAIRALREALSFAQPWNKSVSALEGFLLHNNYCSSDLEGLEHQAGLLVGFVDYVLRENSNKWRGQEPFLSVCELKGAWEAYFGSRPQSMLARSRRQSQQYQYRGNYRSNNNNYSSNHMQQRAHQDGNAAAGSGSLVQVKQEPGSKLHMPQAYFWEDICVMFNLGKCVKPAGTCMTKKSLPLRHVCNHRADASKPNNYCGQDHPAVFKH